MTNDELEKRLQDYYDGKSTLQNEARLRDYFSSNNDIPEHLQAEKTFFQYAANNKNSDTHPIDIQTLIQTAINTDTTSKPTPAWHSLKHYTLSAAASITLITGIYFGLIFESPDVHLNNDTYQDPKLALQEVKLILNRVSTKLNHGTHSLNSLQKFDVAMNQLQPLSSLNYLPSQPEQNLR